MRGKSAITRLSYSEKEKQTSLFGGRAKRTCFVDFKVACRYFGKRLGAVIDFAVLGGDLQSHEDSVIENNCFYRIPPANTNAGSVLDKDSLTAKAIFSRIDAERL